MRDPRWCNTQRNIDVFSHTQHTPFWTFIIWQLVSASSVDNHQDNEQEHECIQNIRTITYDYNYTTQTNEMHNFIIEYLISDVSYTFQNAWVHPKGDNCICSLVCCACIGVSRPLTPMHVGDIRNWILIYKITHFVGVWCITVPQCTVRKTFKNARPLTGNWISVSLRFFFLILSSCFCISSLNRYLLFHLQNF
jgi:hypothetical protein